MKLFNYIKIERKHFVWRKLAGLFSFGWSTRRNVYDIHLLPHKEYVGYGYKKERTQIGWVYEFGIGRLILICWMPNSDYYFDKE